MSFLQKCKCPDADSASSLNIKGDCRQSGGYQQTLYGFKGTKRSFTLNADGSVFDFEIGECERLFKIETRQNVVFTSNPRSGSVNGISYQHTVTIPVNDQNDQATKNAIEALEKEDAVTFILLTQNDTAEIWGWEKGLNSGTNGGGDRTRGALRTDTSRTDMVFQGQEGGDPLTFTRGSFEETLAYLEDKSKERALFNPSRAFSDSGNLAYAITDAILVDYGLQDIVIAGGNAQENIAILASYDNGNTFNSAFVGAQTINANIREHTLAVRNKNDFFYATTGGEIFRVTGADLANLSESSVLTSMTATYDSIVSKGNLLVAYGEFSGVYAHSTNGTAWTEINLSAQLPATLQAQYVLAETDDTFLICTRYGLTNGEIAIYRYKISTTTLSLVASINSDPTPYTETPKLSIVNDQLWFVSIRNEDDAATEVHRITFQNGQLQEWTPTVYSDSALSSNRYTAVQNTAYGLVFVYDNTKVALSKDCGLTWTLEYADTSISGVLTTAVSSAMLDPNTLLVVGTINDNYEPDYLNGYGAGKFYLKCTSLTCLDC